MSLTSAGTSAAAAGAAPPADAEAEGMATSVIFNRVCYERWGSLASAAG